MEFCQRWQFNNFSGGFSRLERVDLIICAAHRTCRKGSLATVEHHFEADQRSEVVHKRFRPNVSIPDGVLRVTQTRRRKGLEFPQQIG